MAAPVPELDPHGLRSSTYGFFTWPPRPLQPLVECVERKFAHSLRLVLPRITRRPRAAARRRTRPRRRATLRAPAIPPSSIMRSAVSMLSLMRTGMPCSGPRAPLRLALGIERVGDRERVGIDLDDRPQRRPAAIDLLDPLQVQLGDLPRTCSARTSSSPAAGRSSLLRVETPRCCGPWAQAAQAATRRANAAHRNMAATVNHKITRSPKRRRSRVQAIDDGAPGPGRRACGRPPAPRRTPCRPLPPTAATTPAPPPGAGRCPRPRRRTSPAAVTRRGISSRRPP